MKLITAHVTNFKSIDDSDLVKIDKVTCLVGKNESGKTAFLQALQKISPVENSDGNFDIMDYPRKGFTKYKQIHEKQPADVVTVEFELTDEEIRKIESDLGKDILKSKVVTATKNYKNTRTWKIQTKEKAAVQFILANSELLEDIKKQAANIETLDEFKALLEKHKDQAGANTLLTSINSRFPEGLHRYIINQFLIKFVPKFVYFDDYCTMEGRISIPTLKTRRDQNRLDESDRTFLALLSLSDNKLEDFESVTNYERLKAELEAASISISDQVFEYWTQNKQLEVEFDISQANPNDPAPLNVGPILHVRIKNNRHRVTVPFDERSRGFIWFFSFFAYFSQIERSDADLILLLDEPGLNLHAKAQGDFLRFIDERLAPKHQVIYTTHSPFMINPNALISVRTVQDVDEKGTKISDDILRNDQDTIFPLQAALGYDLAQTLFIGPNCLLVEGPSDLLYLKILSEAVVSHGKNGLDPRWVVTPVGGADKVSTFVSLLGANELNIAVLIDISERDKQRINNLKGNHFLGNKNLINIGEITGAKDADIEDLFDPTFYLDLVNGAYLKELSQKLTFKSFTNQNPRIVKRIEEHFKLHSISGGHFNHYLPAVFLLNEQSNLLKKIDTATIDRAAALFQKINDLLPK
jgi:predicted ATP-dependent endonuclease of OLD family